MGDKMPIKRHSGYSKTLIGTETFSLLPELNEPGFMRLKSVEGDVRGLVDIGPDFVVIYDWVSTGTIKGHTVKVLESIGRVFGFVYVVGIGMEESKPSWSYWMHMYAKGLVHGLEDDDGELVAGSR